MVKGRLRILPTLDELSVVDTVHLGQDVAQLLAVTFEVMANKRRNVVERAFNKAEHWRAVATRYDKLALTYRAGFTVALIVERLKSLGDTT